MTPKTPKAKTSSGCMSSSKTPQSTNKLHVPTSRVTSVNDTGVRATTPSGRPLVPPSSTPHRGGSPPSHRPSGTNSPSASQSGFRPLRSNEVGHYRKDHKLGVPPFEEALKAAGIDSSIKGKREKSPDGLLTSQMIYSNDMCYNGALVKFSDTIVDKPYQYPRHEGTLPTSKLFPYTEPPKVTNSPEEIETDVYDNSYNSYNLNDSYNFRNYMIGWPYETYNTSQNHESTNPTTTTVNGGDYSTNKQPYFMYKKDRKSEQKSLQGTYTSHNESTSSVNVNGGDYATKQPYDMYNKSLQDTYTSTRNSSYACHDNQRTEPASYAKSLPLSPPPCSQQQQQDRRLQTPRQYH